MKKGSYTIEAAILVPFLMMIMAGAVTCGVDLYTDIAKQKEQEEADFWAVDKFYMVQGIKEVLDD